MTCVVHLLTIHFHCFNSLLLQKFNILGNNFEFFFSGDATVPIGRGTFRGQRQVNIDHFRAPRPQSSLGSTGKQGL